MYLTNPSLPAVLAALHGTALSFIVAEHTNVSAQAGVLYAGITVTTLITLMLEIAYRWNRKRAHQSIIAQIRRMTFTTGKTTVMGSDLHTCHIEFAGIGIVPKQAMVNISFPQGEIKYLWMVNDHLLEEPAR